MRSGKRALRNSLGSMCLVQCSIDGEQEPTTVCTEKSIRCHPAVLESEEVGQQDKVYAS